MQILIQWVLIPPLFLMQRYLLSEPIWVVNLGPSNQTRTEHAKSDIWSLESALSLCFSFQTFLFLAHRSPAECESRTLTLANPLLTIVSRIAQNALSKRGWPFKIVFQEVAKIFACELHAFECCSSGSKIFSDSLFDFICIKGRQAGGFKRGGGFPIWTCPSFLSFFVLFGTFPIFPGFSRFARGWSGDFPDSSLFSFLAF